MNILENFLHLKKNLKETVRLLRVNCDSSNVVTRTCHFDITFLEKCQNCKTGPRFDNDITGIAVHSQQSYWHSVIVDKLNFEKISKMFHSIFEKIAQTTLENKTIRRKLCVVCKLNRATSTNLGNAACDFCGTLFSFVAIALCNKGQLKTCSKFPHPMEMPPATWMKPLCNFGVDVSTVFF